ncbi:MAG TPA: cyanophycinase [Rhodanobacteraceae bacterium]|jgi:cyanophycinase-like exopeptidase|nr:cyanophycinase [Rhodanobacteraceae bacterium]
MSKISLGAIALGFVLLGSGTGSFADEPAPSAKRVEADRPHAYRDPHFDYFVSGDPRLPRATHTDSGVVLFGGGGRVDAGFEFIARKAGGGHIAILRAVSDGSYDATDGDYGESFVKDWGPVVSAETIVFHDREASSDPRVLDVLHRADGIFLAGGDQANYIRYWKGTPVGDALNAHVKAHRPIGGSSAGLAVLGRYAYTALDGGSMESRVALADPFDSGVTLEGDFLHVPGLEHVITDTHFSARSRLGRLIVFIARIGHDDPAAAIYGIGVDEASALLIDGAAKGRLASGSKGHAWVVEEPEPPQLVRGKPLTIAGVSITRIDAGSTLDLATRRVANPGYATRFRINAGVGEPNAVLAAMLTRSVTPPGED